MRDDPEIPDELNYSTSPEANLQIMREINRLVFFDKLAALAPLVARELVAAGVDFSKAKLNERKTSPRD